MYEHQASMSTQPEALRLAEILDLLWLDGQTPKKAAAELRRLHKANQELLEVLTRAAIGLEDCNYVNTAKVCRTAIDAARGEK
jgi:hypothetical protein